MPHSCGAHFLLCDKASIHYQGRAGGEFRVVGTEIEDSCGDLFAGANSRHGNDRSDLVAQFISGKPIPHFGGDHTRSDGVDAIVEKRVERFENECLIFSCLAGSIEFFLAGRNHRGHARGRYGSASSLFSSARDA